ncbi:MAG: adenine phosphoribosyltransferase [Clostridiales bacterium]|nr:adenine phosphoribosyltransferase [Clostridiales bacterium]
MNLAETVRAIPDKPIPGVMFRDITTTLQDPEALHEAIDQMCGLLKDVDFDLVVGSESRGFIFGVPIAYAMHKGFVPVRKPGKLPYKVISKEYSLEYGTDKLEMHIDAIKPGQKVVIVDDLIATGGTSKAMIELIEEAGGVVVDTAFFIELSSEFDCKGALAPYPVHSVLQY